MSASGFKMAALAAAVFMGMSLSPAWAQYNDPSYETTPAQEGAYGETPYVETVPAPPADDLGGTVSGMIGQDPASVPARPPQTYQPDNVPPPTLPPVFDTVAAPVQDTVQEEPQFDDACAAYGNGDAYNMCQDRIKKIERMRDAKNRRMGVEPAAAVQVKAPKTQEDKTKEAVDKVEELEKKLQAKEAADAAKKAAPTTKKGIGDFDRNPEKGNSLFK